MEFVQKMRAPLLQNRFCSEFFAKNSRAFIAKSFLQKNYRMKIYCKIVFAQNRMNANLANEFMEFLRIYPLDVYPVPRFNP